MVRLEVKDSRRIKGILIDGFAPDFSFLKEIDWKNAKEIKLSTRPNFPYTWTPNSLDFDRTYERYLAPEANVPKPLMQSAIYTLLIYSLRDRFCPRPEKRKERCVHRLFPGRGYKSLQQRARYYKGRVHATKEWRVVPIFYEEIEHDEAQGIRNYGMSTLLLNQAPYKRCKAFEECLKNWMGFLDFKIKDENTYLNFAKYKEAAESFLQSRINDAIQYGWFR